ncbi:MAG: host attachment protein [Alphaproteobacteria bacterium]|nr:host attachment protein [Alphaproteobacteria bacterium]MBU0858528.1 host attachment protein [Alphaproteobacteria bacterium]
MQDTQTWYLVANSQNALIFRADKNRLEQVAYITPKNEPATAKRRTSGHQPGGEGSVYYSSNPQDRLNGHDEKLFISEVADWLVHASDDRQFTNLIIAAAPKTLGYIRDLFDQRLKAKIVQEIDHDYTNAPLTEIENLLLNKLH